MVFTTLNPARDTYMLWHRFRMPTRHGTKDAVAVESKVGNELIAAYAFMLEHIVLLVWSITVLAGLVISILRHANNEEYANQYPSKSFSKNIWRKRTSPYSILKFAFRHFYAEKSTRWLIIPWAFIAVAFLVVKYTVPIIFAPYINVGNAAPVNPEAIYFPSLNGSDRVTAEGIKITVEQFELMVPSAQRAISSVNNVISSKNTPVSVSQKSLGIIGDLDGAPVVGMQYEYGYIVTGLDFGLQNHPDLTLNINGSCGTDYTWWKGGIVDSDIYTDTYNFFNNQSLAQNVSTLDGGPTLAFFEAAQAIPPTNSTWGAIISSVNRFSYSIGTDPWYLTTPNLVTKIPPNVVSPGRPALSCWENSVWSYRGHTSNIGPNLSMIPGLDLSDGVQEIFLENLRMPMIVSLGQFLGSASLNSSSSAFSNILNANSSTIFNDLQRLVYASYIATVNIMTETTLFGPNRNTFSVINALRLNSSSNSPLLPGVAEFVIFGNEIVTLDVRSLIVIPTVAIALWILLLVLMFLPIPGKLVARLSRSYQAGSDPEKREFHHDSDKPEVHHVESENLPKLATSEAQDLNISKLDNAVSHGSVVSKFNTETTSESQKEESDIMGKIKKFATAHSSELTAGAKDAVSGIKEDFGDTKGDSDADSGGANGNCDTDSI